MAEESVDLKKTVNLPKTDFSQKANLGQMEPARLKKWQDMNLYDHVMKARDGREKFILHADEEYLLDGCGDRTVRFVRCRPGRR